MRRDLFEAEHEDFRGVCREFFERTCAPQRNAWEAAGAASREAWSAAGAAGLILWEAPVEHGGLGLADYRYNYVLTEEYVLAGVVGLGLSLPNDVLPPYLLSATTDEQRRRWLPGTVRGEHIWAIAMSEPESGSDVRGMRTSARQDGDAWVLNGSKTFISNGSLATHVLVAARTGSVEGGAGLSLFVVEDGMRGFRRGRKLDKIGNLAQDTSELYFDEVRVPAANLVGTVDRGFPLLMQNLAQERLGVATLAVATMRRALDITVAYVRERRVFGQPLGALQNTRFELADCATQVDVATTYVDRAVQLHVDGALEPVEAAGVKQWSTDVQWDVVDRCTQLFGGYGYMRDYEINRLWRDSRIQRVYAGANEVMKEIVGRSLRLSDPVPERERSHN